MAKKIKLTQDDDVFKGKGKDEIVNARAGDDSVSGGGGNDTLKGGAGNDVLKGGAGDDTLNGGADNDILFGGAGDDRLIGGAGDNTVDGGEGDDTIVFSGNFADAKVTAATGGGYVVEGTDGSKTTVSNVELFTFADGTVTTTQMDEKVNGTTGKNFVLTEAVDLVAGTAGDDIITAGLVGANPTLNAGDSITGSGGTDSLNIFGNANAANFGSATITGVENVNAQLSGTTLDVSKNADVKVATLTNGSTGANQLTLTKAQTAGLQGAVGATATLVFSDATAATNDVASVTLNGATLTTGLTAASVETLNVAATGVNALGTLTVANATTLNVTGAGSVSATAAGGGALKTIDASANTGGVTLNIAAITASDLSVKGSTANDTLTTLFANQTAADVIDLGDGANDTLLFTDITTINTALTAALISKVSGVEEIGTVGAVLTVDDDLVSQSRFSTSANGSIVVTNAAQGATVEYGVGTAAASTVAMKLGASTLNVELVGDKTGAAISTLEVTGSSTVNVVSSGVAGQPANSLTLTAADNQSIVLTGSQDTTLAVVNKGGVTGVNIDGSAFTGKATITATDDADIVKGGTGADVITAGDAADTVTGGAGADAFVFTDAATKDTITDFTVSQGDILRFDISELGLDSVNDYAPGASVVVTAAGATALGAGGAANHVIVDTAANILGFTDAGAAWSGPVIAVAKDTGNVYYDADGSFATAVDTVIIGNVTPAEAALIAAGNLDFIA